MIEKKYMVLYNEETVAQSMDIKTATILVRALFEEYTCDYGARISIMEMPRTVSDLYKETENVCM
jgi:hypothetical protein